MATEAAPCLDLSVWDLTFEDKVRCDVLQPITPSNSFRNKKMIAVIASNVIISMPFINLTKLSMDTTQISAQLSWLGNVPI